MLVREVSLDRRTKRSQEDKKKSSEMIEKLRKQNEKLVKGIFRFIQVPGGSIEFAFREFPGEPIRVFEMFDGIEYEIPLGVAKHINNNMKVPKRDYMRDAKGNKLLNTAICGWTQRAEFVSTDLM